MKKSIIEHYWDWTEEYDEDRITPFSDNPECLWRGDMVEAFIKYLLKEEEIIKKQEGSLK